MGKAALREARWGAATLWVLRDNRRARRFYERAGRSPYEAEQTDEVAGVAAVEARYRPLSRGGAPW